MKARTWLIVGVVGSLCAAPALGQDAADPRYKSDELSAILNSDGPTFRADDLTAILTPVRTRSLSPGQGPQPGQPGSGVIPDLKINFRFEVNGHTDAVGSDKYTGWLSGERAAAVKRYLTEQHGIEPERLVAEGWGEAVLAMPNDPKHWSNRRVEVKTIQ